MDIQDNRQRFAQMMQQPEEAIDLAEAALLVAGAEYPELEINVYLEQLEYHTEAVRQRVAGNPSPDYIVRKMNEYLFTEQGFEGNMDDYYNPKNSFLNEVLDRRLGVPISLSLIYMEIGQRLGVPLEGISFPGHFLVKFGDEAEAVVIDPFMKGIMLDNDDLEHRLDEIYDDPTESRPPLYDLLQPAQKKDILLRLLRNLKAVYYQSEEFEKALIISEMIFDVVPDCPIEVRDRGSIYLQLECFRAALADYRSYLTLSPESGDGEQIRAQLLCLQRQVAFLN